MNTESRLESTLTSLIAFSIRPNLVGFFRAPSLPLRGPSTGLGLQPAKARHGLGPHDGAHPALRPLFPPVRVGGTGQGALRLLRLRNTLTHMLKLLV